MTKNNMEKQTDLQTLIEEQEKEFDKRFAVVEVETLDVNEDCEVFYGKPNVGDVKAFLRKSMEMAWELSEPNEAKILDNFIDRLSRRIEEIKAQSDDVYYRSGLSTTLLEAGKLLVEVYPQQLQSPEPEGEKDNFMETFEKAGSPIL